MLSTATTEPAAFVFSLVCHMCDTSSEEHGWTGTDNVFRLVTLDGASVELVQELDDCIGVSILGSGLFSVIREIGQYD